MQINEKVKLHVTYKFFCRHLTTITIYLGDHIVRRVKNANRLDNLISAEIDQEEKSDLLHRKEYMKKTTKEYPRLSVL